MWQAELLGTQQFQKQGQSISVWELGLSWVPLDCGKKPPRSNHVTSDLSVPCPTLLSLHGYYSTKHLKICTLSTGKAVRTSNPHGIAITSPHVLLRSAEMLFDRCDRGALWSLSTMKAIPAQTGSPNQRHCCQNTLSKRRPVALAISHGLALPS